VNIARVEGRLVVVSQPVGVSVYDFDFDHNFRCDHPSYFAEEETCVLRVGAIENYEAEFAERKAMGLRLVNSPEEHARASELEHWYPLLHDLTPRSIVFEQLPPVEDVEASFDWPIFLKGSRQTSRHCAALSVIANARQYEAALVAYCRDDILHWQKPVIREFVKLEPVEGEVPLQVRPSLEFRTFWWNGACVGAGRYWHQVKAYEATDLQTGLTVASEAAARLAVPFLVIDIARTIDGRWIIIECNDGQESGYAGIVPKVLWTEILKRLP
jgi:hypothetical protein